MEGGEEVGEERERKCSQERGGGGISVVRPKEINFSTSWGASCAVILMTEMRGEGMEGKDDHRLYIHTSAFTHLHCHGCVACS